MIRPNCIRLNKRKRGRLRVIELCAGIGQTSIALKNACEKIGIEMIIEACCEIDK